MQSEANGPMTAAGEGPTAGLSGLVARIMTDGDAERLGQEFASAWDGQRAGRWSYLTAWLGSQLAGSGMLRWEGPFIPDIAERLPNQIEVGFLQVPEHLRGRGIGTILMDLAERSARERGARSLGLAVGDDNPRARKLYESLGYELNGLRYTIRYAVEGREGSGRTVEESGVYMVKTLRQGPSFRGRQAPPCWPDRQLRATGGKPEASKGLP
jgi:ribosomal protein S18 acetylase RimI-like enzyme